jgi:hypothetical protein
MIAKQLREASHKEMQGFIFRSSDSHPSESYISIEELVGDMSLFNSHSTSQVTLDRFSPSH